MKITDKWTGVKGPRTTAIGSLPHHNVDTALDFSFKFGIPFLPQIPIRNPWEFMIAQAVEGLPGLQLEDEGAISLNIDIWKSRSHPLDSRLQEAFSQHLESKEAFEAFEPSAVTSSCWQPFLWELQERDAEIAKIQIAGPMTSQWALTLKDGTPLDRFPELATQIFRLVLARALSMVNRMLSCHIQPVLYLDEPGLYALTLRNPKHVLCIQELKLMIQTLRKAGAIVGLHCCSNTQWDVVLSLGVDLLSIDTGLSLDSALSSEQGKSMENFIASGGRLSLGIIPTGRSAVLRTLNAKTLFDQLLATLMNHWESKPELIHRVLREALYTPACGLALQSTSDVELILDKLVEVYEQIPTE